MRKMFHPDTGTEIKVDKEQESLMLDSGWLFESPEIKKAPKKETVTEEVSEDIEEKPEEEITEKTKAKRSRRTIIKK